MAKPPKDEPPNRVALDELVQGASKAAALKAALELEIFTRIAEGHRSLPALLRATGLNERGARILLDALANINLLYKSTFEYALSPNAEAYLVKGKSSYYGDAILARLAWDARGQLSRAIRTGKPSGAMLTEAGPKLQAGRAADTWVEWEAALHEFAPVWKQLGIEDGSGIRQALAFGAEAGLRLLSLLQLSKAVKLTVVDQAIALEPFAAAADKLGARQRVEVKEGDWLAVSLTPDNYDLALVDSITNYRSLEENIGILHRALEALVMGGWIILHADVADDDRSGPGSIPLSGLDMLMASAEGDIYTVAEYRGMLEAAGFFEVKQLGEQPGIVTARRTPPPPPPPPAETVAPDFIPPPETRL